jgi:hypothetical protein
MPRVSDDRLANSDLLAIEVHFCREDALKDAFKWDDDRRSIHGCQEDSGGRGFWLGIGQAGWGLPQGRCRRRHGQSTAARCARRRTGTTPTATGHGAARGSPGGFRRALLKAICVETGAVFFVRSLDMPAQPVRQKCHHFNGKTELSHLIFFRKIIDLR